jgi:small nuclear ribonucleoprotein (snRNP)-like protein
MINTKETDKEAIAKKVPSPGEFLKQAFGRQVTVKLNNDVEYRGHIL